MTTREQINDKTSGNLQNTDNLMFQQGSAVGGTNLKVLGKQIRNPLSQLSVNSTADLGTPSDNADGNGSGYRMTKGLYLYGDSLELGDPIIPTLVAAFFDEMRIDGTNFQTIFYAGTGALLRSNSTSAPYSLGLDFVTIAGDGTNTFLAYTGGEFLILREGLITGFSDLGTVSTGTVFRVNGFTFADNGASLKIGNTQIVAVNTTAFSDTAPYGKSQVELSGSFLSRNFTNTQMIPIAGDYAFKIDPEIDGRVFMSDVNVVGAFGGSPFDPAGIDQTDPRVSVKNCPGIPDSKVKGSLGTTANTSVTNLTVIDTPTPINVASTLWQSSGDERFTATDVCSYSDSSGDLLVTSRNILDAADFNHGLSTDDVFQSLVYAGSASPSSANMGGGTRPGNLAADTKYYVIAVSATTFKLSLTAGGSAIVYADSGTLTNHYKHMAGNSISGRKELINLEAISTRMSMDMTVIGSGAGNTETYMSLMKINSDGTITFIDRQGGSYVDSTYQYGLSSSSMEVGLDTGEGVVPYIEGEQVYDVIVKKAGVLFTKLQ